MEVKDVSPEAAEITAQQPADELDVIEMLTVIARGKKIILTTTLAAALVGLAVPHFLPKRYLATATFLTPKLNTLGDPSTELLASVGVGAAAQSSLVPKSPGDYADLLQSAAINEALIHRFDLMKVYGDRNVPEARKDLQRATSVEADKQGAITISVEDASPQRAVDLTNAYGDELRQVTQELAATDASQRRVLAEQQLLQATEAATNLEEALNKAGKASGRTQPNAQAKAMMSSLALLRVQIAAKEVQLRALRSLDEAKNAPAIQVLDPAIKAEAMPRRRAALIPPLVTLLAFLGSIGYVLLRDGLRRMLSNTELCSRLDTLKAALFH